LFDYPRWRERGHEGRAKPPLIGANIVGYQLPKAGTKVSQIASGVKGFE
jgi:hypothetical protein